MSQAVNEVKPLKKPRVRRSPVEIAELILEAERTGNAAEICRRTSIIQAIGAMKRGPKVKDHDKMKLEAELKRVSAAFTEASIELQLLKKSVNSGY